MYKLRNFSQHGHLPVSRNEEKYCFDLKQIVDKPRFKHKKEWKEEMEKIINEIRTKYRDVPNLAFTITLADYVAKLLSVYNCFWPLVKPDLDRSNEDFNRIISAYPKNIIPRGMPFEGCFIYKMDCDNIIHGVHIEDNPQKDFNGFQEEATNVYNEYEQALQALTTGSVFVHTADNGTMEISNSFD